MALAPKPDFKAIDAKWLKYWEDKHIYKFDAKSKKPIYSVDTPPPTVSGRMHLGHSFSYTQQDIIVRYQRMLGKNIFYPFGTDDNGLATERLIEKLKNVKGSKMPRHEFIALCLKTLEEIRPPFIQDWKKIGLSADFSLAYSTIDAHSRKISQWSFIDLYKKGREYRKEAPTIWCPECETAISQVELEDVEIDATFNYIKFKLEDKKDLIIATTRPELLGSCVAIFVNPEDHRYEKLVGKKAKVPLFDKWVTIKKDSRVSIEKGTGAVMCCTFGDQTDIEWYRAHNLPLLISITKDGKMNENAGKYSGMKIEDARKAVIEDLKAEKLLVDQKKIKHAVNVHERCKTPVEILNTKQWFIKYLDLKKRFLQAGQQFKWYPEHMRVRYDNWIKGLQWDWVISRQRFFGVPFPVWYCKKCDEVIIANEKDLPVDPLKDKPPVKGCPKCKSAEFVPEKDVLDTWTTSSLTPKLAIDLVKSEAVREKLFPMDLRPQAHDIITFWLFNTVVKSLLHTEKAPWKHAIISGHVQDEHGRKMSKSLGNTVEPLAILEKFSADALRYFASTTKLGEDAPFQEKELVHAQKLVIKLWNVAKFFELWKESSTDVSKNVVDNWILSRIAQVTKQYKEAFDNYDFFGARRVLEDFFWHEYCDFYLEMIKYRLYSKDKKQVSDASWTLYKSFSAILKLFAPIIPFITEEIYQNLFKEYEGSTSIHVTKFDEGGFLKVDPVALELGNIAVEIISEIRKYKASKSLGPGAELEKLTVEHPNPKAEKILDEIAKTARIKDLHIEKGELKVA